MAAMYAVQLSFSDDTARLALRPAHRETLAGHAADGTLLAAGPWSDDSGALLVFAVDTRDELDAILAADPYYAALGRRDHVGPGVEPGDPAHGPRRALTDSRRQLRPRHRPRPAGRRER